MGEVVLAVPDLHFPWAHKDHLKFLSAVKRKYNPSKTVFLGDELDQCALSNFDHDPDGYGAKTEFEKGMEDMRRIYTLFPKAQVCLSNHSARPFRRAAKYGIPSLYLKEYKDFMEAPGGWSWHDKIEIDEVLYIHGEGCSGPLGAINAANGYMQSVCIGHLHCNAGILWNANPKHLFFGFNVGCLIDHKAYAFAYSKHQVKKPILGCGIIDNKIPTFIPLLMNSGGRWVGSL